MFMVVLKVFDQLNHHKMDEWVLVFKVHQSGVDGHVLLLAFYCQVFSLYRQEIPQNIRIQRLIDYKIKVQIHAAKFVDRKERNVFGEFLFNVK